MKVTPSNPAEWRAHAQALFHQGDLGGASRAFQTSFGEQGPQNAADFLSLSRFEIFLANYEQAAQHVSRALVLSPGNPEILLTKSRIELFRGDRDAAKTSIEQGLSRSPKHPILLYQALELFGASREDLLASAEAVAEVQSIPTLKFGLARALDKRGDHDRAWQMATEANALQASGQPGWSRQNAEATLRASIGLYTAVQAGDAHSDLRPIYLTGSPRCGGTLIETLISAHPDIASAGERGAMLPWLINASQSFAADQKSSKSFSVQREALARADETGLRSTGISEVQFTDKTPANAEFAGLLARVHSRAQFVEINRDHRDIAVSIFFHEFPSGYPYSMNIQDIADYLSFRAQAIGEWEAAGLTFNRVNYESFVTDPAAQGRQLYEALGLEWSDAYLSPEARSAPARTFSASAVRESINTRKVEAWKRYEQHLANVRF